MIAQHAIKRDVRIRQTSSMCHVPNVNGQEKQSASMQMYHL